MKQKANYNIHFIMISAMFVLSNAVITVPFGGADRNNFLSFVIATVLGAGLLYLSSYAIDYLYDIKRLSKNLFAVKVFYVLSSAVLVFIAALCFKDYTDFVAFRMLPQTPRLIVSFIFVLCVFWTSVQKDSVILKFSLFSFVITAIIIILLFVISVPRMKFENIVLLQLPDIKDTAGQTWKYFLNVYVTLLPILLYRKCLYKDMKNKYISSGLLSGAVLLSVCLLNSLLLFSADVACNIDFPYADAISTVTVGELFTRMDGFSYFVFFASTVIKITVCISGVKILFSRLGIKNKRAVSTACCLLILICDCLVK